MHKPRRDYGKTDCGSAFFVSRLWVRRGFWRVYIPTCFTKGIQVSCVAAVDCLLLHSPNTPARRQQK